MSRYHSLNQDIYHRIEHLTRLHLPPAIATELRPLTKLKQFGPVTTIFPRVSIGVVDKVGSSTLPIAIRGPINHHGQRLIIPRPPEHPGRFKKPEQEDCPTCEGKGYYFSVNTDDKGRPYQVRVNCGYCDGTGKVNCEQ